MKIRFLFFLVTIFLFCGTFSIELPRVLVEGGGFASTGNYAPFWFYSNQYGVFAENNNSLYNRLYIFNDTNRERKNIQFSYGLDVYGKIDPKANFQLNQFYGGLKLYFLNIKAGLFRQIRGNHELSSSSGSILFSSNARPYPQISVGIENYTAIPYTRGLIEVKGEVSHGWAENKNRWVKDSYIHYKFVNVKIGGHLPIHLNFGFHHSIQWGGTSIFEKHGKQPGTLKDFLYLFFAKNPPNSSVVQGESFNKIGNHLGSRQYGLDYDFNNSKIGMYYQTLFEDNSGNVLISKDGDGLYGLSYKSETIFKEVVFEVLKTTYQSGPIELVWVPDVPVPFWDSKGGNDNYFNNYVYQSWTYFGNTIGTPFITSPGIKKDSVILNNRVLAFYFSGIAEFRGFQIEPKYSYSINKGTYSYPINDMRQHSMMLKVSKFFQAWSNIQLHFQVGYDSGSLFENTLGIGVGAKKVF